MGGLLNIHCERKHIDKDINGSMIYCASLIIIKVVDKGILHTPSDFKQMDSFGGGVGVGDGEGSVGSGSDV